MTELANAVALYEGIQQECLDKLKDGPYAWPKEKVADAVRSEMLKFKPTCIVTFDDKGVSGEFCALEPSLCIQRSSKPHITVKSSKNWTRTRSLPRKCSTVAEIYCHL